MGVLAAACTPNVVPSSDDGNLVFTSDGGTKTYEYTASSSWSILCSDKWLTFSPSSGGAGKVSISVKCDPNEDVSERKSSVYILDGTQNNVFSVKQAAKDDIVLSSDRYYVPMGGEFRLKVGANVAFTVSSDADWISCPSTKSEFTESELVFQLQNNPSDKPREASVSFKSETVSKTVTFVQGGWVDIDWDKPFFKSVLASKFTATWCGNCPSMSYAMEQVEESMPGRLAAVSFYAENEGDYPELRYTDIRTVERFYAAPGYPTLAMDDRGYFANEGAERNFTIISNFIEECVSEYPAQTSVTAKVSVNSNSISISGTVFAKTAGEYRINVVIMENGIVAAQHDYANIYSDEELRNYVHNHVAKAYVTTFGEGDEVSISAKSSCGFEYTVDLPSNTVKAENLSALIYVTRPVRETMTSSVARITYYRNKSHFVDNAAVCHAGSSIDVKYE